MTSRKINELLTAARQAAPPPAPEAFHQHVLRALRREPRPAPAPASMSLILLGLFPRVLAAAVVLIALCAAADVCLASLFGADVADGVVAISQHWLFAGG